MTDMRRSDRVLGALVGSAVGDALGAPFEFGPAGAFSARFPSPARGTATEMCSGGSLDWEPGEFTDDTQMALLVATSLLEQIGLDEADLFGRFRAWAAADPPDVGIQTRAVLGSGRPWHAAAAEHFQRTGRAAGNGSLMRATPAAIRFARDGREATMDAARRIGAHARRPVHRRRLRGLPRAGAGGPGRRRPAGRDPGDAGVRGARAPRAVGDGAGTGLDAGPGDRDQRRGLADARAGRLGAAQRPRLRGGAAAGRRPRRRHRHRRRRRRRPGRSSVRHGGDPRPVVDGGARPGARPWRQGLATGRPPAARFRARRRRRGELRPGRDPADRADRGPARDLGRRPRRRPLQRHRLRRHLAVPAR
jgi:hypothetical protein